MSNSKEIALTYRVRTGLSSFFKDRKWLRLEFPELMDLTKEDVSPSPDCLLQDDPRLTTFPSLSLQAGPRTIVEIGCVSCLSPGMVFKFV